MTPCVRPTSLRFTGANPDAPSEGSRHTVKQRFASGATASRAAAKLRLLRQTGNQREAQRAEDTKSDLNRARVLRGEAVSRATACDHYEHEDHAEKR